MTDDQREGSIMTVQIGPEHLATIDTVRSVYGMVMRETDDRAEHSAAMHICARLAEVAAYLKGQMHDD